MCGQYIYDDDDNNLNTKNSICNNVLIVIILVVLSVTVYSIYRKAELMLKIRAIVVCNSYC